MSTDMIKDMAGGKHFNYHLTKKPESALIKKKEELKSNPDRVAYESNVKQPAGKIFQVLNAAFRIRAHISSAYNNVVHLLR